MPVQREPGQPQSAPTAGLVLHTATCDITPDPGHPLGGYAARGDAGALGRHDPLQATLICLSAGPCSAAWLTLDSIAVDVSLAEDLRAVVGKALAIPPEHVVVCASHTHSGPAGWVGALHPADTEEREDDLVAELVAAVGALAEDAATTAQPVEAHWCLAATPGVAANRQGPQGPHDDRTGVLVLRAPGGTVQALLYDHAGHPTVLGPENLLWSADWPGAARAVLGGALAAVAAFAGAPSTPPPAIGFLQGPAGDASPRLLRRGRDFAEVARFGAVLAGPVLRAVHEEARALVPGALPRVLRTTVELPVRPSPTAAEAARELAAAEAAWRPLAGTPQTPQARIAATRLDGARRQVRLVEAALPGTLRLPISVVTLGGLAWVHLPVELTGALAERIVAAGASDTVRVVGYSDGYFGYVTDDAAHRAGTYEALSSLFTADAAQTLVARAVALLAQATAGPAGGPGSASET